MTTYCLTLLRCAILLSVHTGLTWEQQGVPCLHATYLNTEDILPLDASRSSLLRTQTCGYPLAEHKNLPMMWSLHHLNNEPDLNIGLCMTSSKKIGQVPRVDHHEFLTLLDSESRLMVIENNVFVSEGEIDSSEKVKHIFMTEKVNDTISVELQAGSNVLKVRDGPTTFDHQPIVILEDDPVVMESASFLFNKQPSVSTLMRYHKGVLQVIMGSKTHLTKNSRVVLVGHGSKGSNGVARLGGYGPDKLAKVLVAMEIGDGRLHSLNLVGCALGKDLQFAEQLLQALRSHNVDTELHLSTSELSVSPSGEILTREEGVWRQQDSSKKVIAQLDQNGIIMSRVEGSNRGQVIPNYMGHVLIGPEKPELFVDNNVRNQYPEVGCLEALAWGIFGPNLNNIQTTGKYQKDQNHNWVCVRTAESQGVPPCSAEAPTATHIVTITDLLVAIKNQVYINDQTYYVLNHCLYYVHTNLYAYYVGCFIPNGWNQNRFDKKTRPLLGKESYKDIMADLDKNDYYNFILKTFDNNAVFEETYKFENWGLYFMASVFSESVRNFRLIPLFLMSRVNGPTNLKKLYDANPMAAGGSWVNTPKRGFYGCSTPTNPEKLMEVIGNEATMFNNLKTEVQMTLNSLTDDLTNFVGFQQHYLQYITYLETNVKDIDWKNICLMPEQ